MMARWPTQTRRIVSASLLLALVLLTSCSYFPGPPTILTLATLQGPGLKKLSLFANLRPAFLASLTVATPAGQSSPLVFAAVDFYLYVGRLDGSGQHKINMASSGCPDPSFTAGAGWVVCTDYPANNTYGTAATPLEIASLHDPANLQASGFHDVNLQDDNGQYSYPHLSPDGTMLAVANGDAGGCTLQLEATQPPYRDFTYQLSLNDPQVPCGPTPPLEGRWSPDGQYLLVNGLSNWYLIPVSWFAKLLHDFSLTTGVTPVVSLPSNDVFAPFSQAVIEDVAWGPQPHELTYATIDKTTGDRSVRVVNIVTGQERELFSISRSEQAPYGVLTVGGIAWTPDGRQLIFSVEDADRCIDCNAYRPAQLYSYTPPLPSHGPA